MQRKTVEEIIDKIRVHELNLEKILYNYNRALAESTGWFTVNKNDKASEARVKGALAAAATRKTTNQEKEIAKMLSKLNIKFKQNFPINSKSIVDFYIKDLKTIIECKKLDTYKRRNQTQKIKELAYQGYKIKFFNKNMYLIAAIETRLPLQKTDYEELKGPFDLICTNLKELYDHFDQ